MVAKDGIRRFFSPKVVFSIFLILCTVQSNRLLDNEKVLNVCMDGRHHLTAPRKEDLHGSCQPWGNNTCCSNVTSFYIHIDKSPLYNFNLSHCGTMSEKCFRRFVLSNCFYECSPNVGPWLVPVKSSIRNERFLHVPLCANECQAWFDDCKDDLTCVDNWSEGFVWKNRINTCPSDSKCRNFTSVFHNATNFCESVFPGDFKVVSDKSACMTLSFKGPENPNAKVAVSYALKKKLISKETIGPTKPSKKDEVGTPSHNDSVILPYDPPTKTAILQQTGTTVAVVLTSLFIFILVLGFIIYKCRSSWELSRRSGIKYFPCFDWLRGRGHNAPVLHHPAPTDDRAFLQDEDEEDDYDLNPHGTLEINL